MLHGKRVILPIYLQAEGQEVLHSVQQDTTGMTTRATGSVHWSGMQNDFARKMAACTSCDERALSQPTSEQVYSNYLAQHGSKSLITIDRHLAWRPVHGVRKKEGALGLISALMSNNTTFAVNMEIASDSPDTSLSHP
jgi:hypothetical protein